MGEVNVLINGKNYSIACDDGQEERVSYLARDIDARISEIARAGAATTDAHLLVLTSLIMADEIYELREALQAGGQGGSTENAQAAQNRAEDERQLVEAIHHMADRIDDVAGRLTKISKKAA